MKASLFNVSDYFINRSYLEEDSIMTPLKLQKLVYYAQAWNLVLNNKKLINARFEAWAHGPVNIKLYNRYRNKPYIEVLNEKTNSNYKFNKEEERVLDEVWQTYGCYSGHYLEKLTHQEDPWIKARGDFKEGERCNNVISEKIMKEYYSKYTDEN